MLYICFYAIFTVLFTLFKPLLLILNGNYPYYLLACTP